jgi:ABC-2 type transport system permease protein
MQRDLGFALRPRLRPVPSRDHAAAVAQAATGRFAAYTPTHAWSLRSPYLRALRVSAGGALWWALGAGGYAVWMTAVGKQLQGNLAAMAQASPALAPLFARLLDPSAGSALFLDMLVFTFVPVALCAFAIVQVARWGEDEEAGVTDMLLAYPVSRVRALLVTFGATGTVIVGLSLALGVAVGVAAAVAEIAIDPLNLVAATLGLAPVLFLVACLGALLSGWLRSGAVTALLTTYVVTSFVLVFIGPAFGWPRALIALSAFDAYGQPLVDGWRWGPPLALTGISAALLGLAAARFRRKDLAR